MRWWEWLIVVILALDLFETIQDCVRIYCDAKFGGGRHNVQQDSTETQRDE